MNKFSILAIGLLAAVSTASAQNAASVSSRMKFYAQPSVVVAFPGDFDTAAGGALALGVTVDGVHSVEAEVIYFKSGIGSTDVTFMPLLATYKYGIKLNQKLTLQVGGSIGATRESASFYWYSDQNKTAFTYGATGGVSYALTDRVSVVGNALVLGLENTTITTSGSIAIVTAGVNFRF